MFIVLEKIEFGSKINIYGVFDFKDEAKKWIDFKKKEPINKRKYLKRTWSIKPILKPIGLMAYLKQAP